MLASVAKEETEHIFFFFLVLLFFISALLSFVGFLFLLLLTIICNIYYAKLAEVVSDLLLLLLFDMYSVWYSYNICCVCKAADRMHKHQYYKRFQVIFRWLQPSFIQCIKPFSTIVFCCLSYSCKRKNVRSAWFTDSIISHPDWLANNYLSNGNPNWKLIDNSIQ